MDQIVSMYKVFWSIHGGYTLNLWSRSSPLPTLSEAATLFLCFGKKLTARGHVKKRWKGFLGKRQVDCYGSIHIVRRPCITTRDIERKRYDAIMEFQF